MKRLLPRLTERNALVLLLILIFAFGGYISEGAAYALLYAAAYPWAMIMICRDRKDDGMPQGMAFKWAVGALGIGILSVLVTMTAKNDWAYTVGSAYICWLLLAFPPRKETAKNLNDGLFGVGACMVTLFLPFALVALLSVFTGRLMSLPGIDTHIGIQKAGLVSDRVRIMTHFNVTARYAAFNVLFSIFAIISRKGWLTRGWFGLNLIPNLLVLVHTQSRTCYIALSAALGLIVMRALYLKLGANWKGFIAGAVAAVIVFALTLSALNGLFAADVRIAARLSGAGEMQTASHSDKYGQFDVTGTGRGELWRMLFDYLKAHPKYLLTGMGEGVLTKIIAREIPAMDFYWHTHNSLLGSLMHYGALYLICVLGFLVCMVRPCWRLLMRPAGEGERGLFIAPVLIVAMLLMSLTEEMLFATPCYTNLLFFLCCGIVLRCDGISGEGRKTKGEM